MRQLATKSLLQDRNEAHLDMMHREIDEQEIIERYVRNQLTVEERRDFEEHFFGCEECFEKLRTTERFIAGMRDAGSRGLLERNSADAVPVRTWAFWVFPALAASSCAVVALAIVASWTLLVQMPRLRQQLSQSSADLSAQRQAIATLQTQLASGIEVESNVPLVMLQATRDAEDPANDAVLPLEARHLTLWIDLPSTTSGSFFIEISTTDGRHTQTVQNLKRNTYGALVVSLPAEILQSGVYTVKLSRQEPSPVTLIAEYRLRIRRP
jgi:hypothetical protein